MIKKTGKTPLNNRKDLKGVFLSASRFNHYTKGDILPTQSPYGDRMFAMDCNRLIFDKNNNLKNLYLAGYYDFEGKVDYVILLIIDKEQEQNSDVKEFHQLDWKENPFLTFIDNQVDCLQNTGTQRVYIEIFHVGDIILEEKEKIPIDIKKVPRINEA